VGDLIMDWAKAKTILIAVFLAGNIFLAYMIIGANNGNVGYVDNENIKLITDYLAEKHIFVKDQVPAKKIGMPSITVKYKLFKKEDIIKRIFSPEEKVAEAIEGNILKFKSSNIEVSIKDSRELSYMDNSIRPAAAIEEKACSKNIKEFLDRLGMKDDASIRMVEDLEGYKKFTYGQSFKGAPIYNSIMEFYVNDAGVYKANILWFETIKQAGSKADVI
jgi:regulatory protein YycI of two-component signal transduction system YycFG